MSCQNWLGNHALFQSPQVISHTNCRVCLSMRVTHRELNDYSLGLRVYSYKLGIEVQKETSESSCCYAYFICRLFDYAIGSSEYDGKIR